MGGKFRIAITLGMAVWLSGAASAQNPDLQQRWAERFLEAYEQGTPQALEQFCDLYQVPSGVDPDVARRFCAGYLYRYRLRYGPVRVIQVEQRPHGPRHWLEGTLTGAVWGIGFMPTETDPPTIDGASVMQGLLPPNYQGGQRVEWRNASQFLESHFASLIEADLFSGVVLVARGDEILFHRAYGLADRESGEANRLETRFRIASVGKMLTAMAALNLVDAGRLELDAPIQRYYPQYPALVSSQVTLRHLLTHTSGLEIDDYDPFNQAVDRAENLDQILAAQIEHIEHMNEGRFQNFRPLGSYDYSNENLDLVGGLLQRVDGGSWDGVVRSRVLHPSAIDGFEFVQPQSGFAKGYSTLQGSSWGYELRDSAPLLKPIARPAGSEFATAMALFRFMRFVENRRRSSAVVDQATRQQVSIDDSGPVKAGYGLGFETEQHACFRSYGHTGAQAGASGVARHYPDQGVTIVILANRDGVAVDAAEYLERSLLHCDGSENVA